MHIRETIFISFLFALILSLSSCEYGDLDKADIAIFHNASELMIQTLKNGAQNGKTIVKIYDFKDGTTCESLGYTKIDNRASILSTITSMKSVGVILKNYKQAKNKYECSLFDTSKTSAYRGNLHKLMTIIEID